MATTIEYLIMKVETTPSGAVSITTVPSSDANAFGELFQNTSTPGDFVVSHLVDTPWNQTNAGAITKGAENKISVDNINGEIPLTEAGDYEVSISGSIKSNTADVQLCAVLFADETMVPNVCDFPATRADGKYTIFNAAGILKNAAGTEKLTARFKALDGATETCQLRNLTFKAKKIK